jgi:hypothetical protein
MPMTPGKALSPLVPQQFDEVLRAIREGDKFHWSNMEARSICKARYLKLSKTISADHKDIFNAWMIQNNLTFETLDKTTFEVN